MPPAQRVEFLLGLLRVEGDDAAVVLVALLAGDVDVVVQRHGVVGEAALDDVGDGLAVDALGDGPPQRRSARIDPGAPLNVKWYQDRPGARRIAMPAVRRAICISSSVARPVASIVLFCRAGMRAASSRTR